MNQAVDLTDDENSFHAVVIYESDDSVILLKPASVPDVIVPEYWRFTMTWAGDSSLMTLPVTVTEGVIPGFDRPVWEVMPRGEREDKQRRVNTRLSMSRTMQITNFLYYDSSPEEAKMLDISQSGLRCSLTDLEWLNVPIGTNTRVRFTFDDLGPEFIADAGVSQVRARPAGGKIVAQVVALFRVRDEWRERLQNAIRSEELRRLELDERRQKIHSAALGAARTHRPRRPH